jgi:hypothetical protein
MASIKHLVDSIMLGERTSMMIGLSLIYAADSADIDTKRDKKQE